MTQKKPIYTDESGRRIIEQWENGKLRSVFVEGYNGRYTEQTNFDEAGNKISVYFHNKDKDIIQNFENGYLVHEVVDELRPKKGGEYWEWEHAHIVSEFYPDKKKSLKHSMITQGGITEELSFFESGKIASKKWTKENGDFNEEILDEKGTTQKRSGKIGENEFHEVYYSSGNLKEESVKNEDGYEYKHYTSDSLGRFCDREIKRDLQGRGYEKVYRSDRTLMKETEYFGMALFILKVYEEDGKTLSYQREQTQEGVKVSHYEKGKLKDYFVSVLDVEKDQTITKYFDAKGRLTSSEIQKYLNDGSRRTDFFDAKGKFTEYELETANNQSNVWTIYAPDGKLLKQINSAYEQGKYVEIIPDRSLLYKLLDLPQGGTMGDVSKVSVSEERKKTNSKLKSILKDKSLSSAEKKEKSWKAAAEYRATHAKAPNPKVHKKLMEIHQAEK